MAVSRLADNGQAMPMTQDDIRRHYEQDWKTKSDQAGDSSHLAYSSPVEDAILYPIYERMIRDLKIKVDGGRVLDVGSGSGRWIRFFLDRFAPTQLVGIDFTQASVDLLKKWCGEHTRTGLVVHHADITDPNLPLALEAAGSFDLINVANVLFHVPEADKFAAALRNCARLAAPDGRIVVTEYLPRSSGRTNWMLVRSRYEFEAAAHAAELRIVDIRACTFFGNDAMGLDGPDQAVRGHFHKVRAGMQSILSSNLDVASRKFFIAFLADIERALLAFCAERIAPIDMPSQKLLVLSRER